MVYKARHGLMDRIVAIKMLQAQLVSDQLSVARFHQESKAASRINHPHVITIYDFGISPQGLPYIVMDYLAGDPLSDAIRENGQIGVDRTLKIAIQTCDALAHAHKQGVVHRDLKPGNIVLTTFNEDKDYVKVVDFGVAKLMNQGDGGQRLTQAGEVCGSPVYMSPEQCMGQELDSRSDIYSMGIVLYETLTGKLPILGKTMVDTMSKHCSEMPPSFKVSRPDLYIPERLEAIIFKALAKNPADRQQSMDELKVDLESAIPRAGRTATLRTDSPDLSKTVLSHNAHNPFSTAKYSVIFMGLGAVLAFLIAFVGFKMMTLNTVMNKKQATAITDTTKNTIPSTTIDSATSTKTDIPDKETESSEIKASSETKASSDIQKLVSPVRHKLGAVHKVPVEHSESHDTVSRIVVAPEVHKPKHPRHIAEKAPAQEAPHATAPHPVAPKSSENRWDILRSQLKN